MPDNQWQFDTLVVHGAQTPGEWQQSTLAPIYQSAANRFETAEELSEVFAGNKPGFIYQRLRNPTNEALEKRLCLLEGGVGAVVTSSGMAAINDSVIAICRAGDQIVSANSLFQATFGLFTNVLARLGIGATLVETCDLSAWEAAVTDRTKLLYVETIGNPQMDVPSIQRLAELAHAHRAPLIVDNTLASPYLFRPLDHGADVVVHSTTKYFNGHGSAVGGVVIDGGRFDWPEDKYPEFKPYKERRGNLAYIDKMWRDVHVTFGTSQAPFHSYLTLIGLDTMALRMERHMANAMKLAEFLASHPRVEAVRYPGLGSSPWHQVAVTQFQGRGYGGLMAMDVGSERAAFEFIRRVRLAYHLANLGDCKTLVIHPWSSQYVSFTEESRLANGITPGLIRISTGIEAIDDILEDFDQALLNSSASRRRC